MPSARLHQSIVRSSFGFIQRKSGAQFNPVAFYLLSFFNNKGFLYTIQLLRPLRANSQWLQLFDRRDYGLITTREDLQELEVLVLEIIPSAEYKNDEDILKEYLTK